MTTTTTGPTHPKPMRKQIRATASTVQQGRINDLSAKRHKSNAHKVAVRLFNAEKQKPDGMSIRLLMQRDLPLSNADGSSVLECNLVIKDY